MKWFLYFFSYNILGSHIVMCLYCSRIPGAGCIIACMAPIYYPLLVPGSSTTTTTTMHKTTESPKPKYQDAHADTSGQGQVYCILTIRYDHHVSVVLARNRHHATALHVVVRTSEHWPTKHKQRENGFEAKAHAVGTGKDEASAFLLSTGYCSRLDVPTSALHA